MKKIVQLDEYEYNKLAELAKLNEEQINQKAARFVGEKRSRRD